MSLVHLDATRLFLRRQGWRAGDFDPLQRTKLNLPVKAAELSALLEHGLLVLTAGPKTIRLLPPLVISQEEMDTGLAALKDVLVP